VAFVCFAGFVRTLLDEPGIEGFPSGVLTKFTKFTKGTKGFLLLISIIIFQARSFSRASRSVLLDVDKSDRKKGISDLTVLDVVIESL
jgi:hypothetical protein